MTNASTDSLRRAASAGIVGATGTAIGGLVVQLVVQPATKVSDEMWSYPFSSAALVPISILGAFLHILVLIAVLGFARSGLAGASRSAHIGLLLALGGTALLLVGELASIPVRDQRVDDQQLRVDPLRIHLEWQAEGSPEGTAPALATMVALSPLWLVLSLAPQGDRVAVNRDLQVILFDARQLGGDHDTVLVGIDVDSREAGSRCSSASR